MTGEAHSSTRLADALEAEGFSRLARRARNHEFHDFLSPHALPQHELVAELAEFGNPAAERLKLRVMEGEFDASKAESDEWANSPDGQATMQALTASRLAPETGLVDDNHVLLVGNILGALMRLGADPSAPTQVEPIRDKGGNYTNRILLTRQSGEYLVTVEKGGAPPRPKPKPSPEGGRTHA